AGLTKYYPEGGDWPFITVKTGDEISLGKRTLRFIEAPMLHWPDSMFTYLVEGHILMPNDAFGQHIATSKRFDDEVPKEDIMGEAAKYYANILMPFAPLILRKIAEVQGMGIPLDMIAPSHGIIWRSEPKKIIDAYVKWSQGHAEEKVLVIYDTMWESTEVMAKAIVQGIMREGVETRLFHLRKSDWTEILKEILEAKAILIGSPTLNNGMFPSVGGFLTYLKGLRPQKKVAAAFGSYGWGKGAVKAINEELKRTGLDVLDPGLEVRYLPTEDEVKNCVEFGASVARRVKEIRLQ
ncbi:MAG: flavodoxin domain-containing protein, partial [Candidatus Bathyarchaeia archaeon]